MIRDHLIGRLSIRKANSAEIRTQTLKCTISRRGANNPLPESLSKCSCNIIKNNRMRLQSRLLYDEMSLCMVARLHARRDTRKGPVAVRVIFWRCAAYLTCSHATEPLCV